MARHWTQEEIDYLQDKWGNTAIKTIAKNLNRSVYSIKLKVQRLRLGPFLESAEYITVNQFFKAIGIAGGTGYKNYSWIKSRSLPIKYKTVEKCKFKIIYIKDFWKWAENNKSFVDWSKIEHLVLGKEPSWVNDMRNISKLDKSKYRTTKWTIAEDNMLKTLLKTYHYGYKDLSERLGRTEGAIQRRILNLGLKERPLKADTHIKWTDEDKHTLVQMIERGYTYQLMSDALNKSSKAIRGRVYVWYGTENLDRVRARINDN